jgi:hypothetical protein
MQYNFIFVFKKYDRQNHVWSFMTKYLRFLCKFTSWSGETPTGNFRLCWLLAFGCRIPRESDHDWQANKNRLSIVYEYQQFFQHLICFSIQSHATHSDPWPTLARSTSLFLICCYNYLHSYLLYFVEIIFVLH